MSLADSGVTVNRPNGDFYLLHVAASLSDLSVQSFEVCLTSLKCSPADVHTHRLDANIVYKQIKLE